MTERGPERRPRAARVSQRLRGQIFPDPYRILPTAYCFSLSIVKDRSRSSSSFHSPRAGAHRLRGGYYSVHTYKSQVLVLGPTATGHPLITKRKAQTTKEMVKLPGMGLSADRFRRRQNQWTKSKKL
jgi:hypothetical protein